LSIQQRIDTSVRTLVVDYHYVAHVVTVCRVDVEIQSLSIVCDKWQ